MNKIAKGVWTAALTPQKEDFSIDFELMIRHYKWLFSNGCDGIAVLGTTGEANSFTVAERLLVIDALGAADVPLPQIMIGTGCCSIPDTIELTKAALEIGCTNILMLPPFYYKTVSEDGLFGTYDHIIQIIGDERLNIIVYDFPQMTGLEINNQLLVRLWESYPDIIVGIKDSSGNWADMKAICDSIPGFATFSGTEQYLLDILLAGGAGCITATGNVTAALCQTVYKAFSEGNLVLAEAAQKKLKGIRLMLQGHGGISVLKEIIAAHTGNYDWRNMRLPNLPIDRYASSELFSDVKKLDLDIPKYD